MVERLTSDSVENPLDYIVTVALLGSEEILNVLGDTGWINCIFDEAGIMPSLKSIDNMVSFGASAGFRLTLAVQDTSQLERRYGSEVAHTLMNNMQNFAYLMGGDPETLKNVSEKAGKRLIWNEEQGHYDERPVISTERLSKLSMGEALIIQLRKNPVLTRLLGYRDYCFYENTPKGDVSVHRSLKHVPYFDLKQAYQLKENPDKQVISEMKSKTTEYEMKPEIPNENKEQKNDKLIPGYLDLENTQISSEEDQ